MPENLKVRKKKENHETKNKDTQPEIDHSDVLPFRVGRLLRITIALEVIFDL